MLGADVAGAGAGGLGNGQLHGALGTGRQPLRGCGAGNAGAYAAVQDVADHLVGESVLLQHTVGNALLFPQQAQQQVLGAHIAMSHILSGLLGQTQSLLCTRGEFIFHHKETLPFKRCGDLPKLLPGHYC